MSENEQDAFDPHSFNQNLIDEYRANGGKVTGMFAGAPLLLLTTRGARSGEPRVAPLAYTTDNGRFVVSVTRSPVRPSIG